MKFNIHNLLALLVILLSFTFLFLLLFVQVPKENEQIINIAAGAILVSGFAAIISYFFGNSKKQIDIPDMPNTTLKTTETTTVE